ncbi:hypothetical protein [Staphylococcus felis]|uniref:Uncharacterized protein n=1 Tax=Staphylococcus felis TaxID=46127 RepID=A0ABS0QMX1_9STAP|nr:hypothetical protein [Staphylococcus felis]MBH9580070.1 hypothetical protein [Staphylococcus felis]REI05457.1 hypothetical protein DOS69_10165 [Staphylococcus felis]REI33640.1 hypothetical protein DOS82_05950 [Staphylococcus felis]
MFEENLLKETIDILNRYGKTLDDIVWIGGKDFTIPLAQFVELADKKYDSGYGGEEVAIDLKVVGNNWWLERAEYDGSEWWEFKTPPSRPLEEIKVKRVISTSYSTSTLKEINQ